MIELLNSVKLSANYEQLHENVFFTMLNIERVAIEKAEFVWSTVAFQEDIIVSYNEVEQNR